MLTKRSFDKISKILFITCPITKFVKPPQQSSFFLHFFEDFRSSKSCMIRFKINFPEIYSEKLINFELPSQIYIKIKKLDYLFKNLLFRIDYILKKINQFNLKNVEMLLVWYSFVIYTAIFFTLIYGHLFLRLLLCMFLVIRKI